MRRHARRGTTASYAVAAALALCLTGCGQAGNSHAPAKSAQQAVDTCRAQWKDVAESVVGMDQDDNPSALADRWTSVIATVDYYRTTDEAKDCQSRVDAQLKAVTALRQFSEKLRPYDMTYQLGQVRAAIDLYLNDPLPGPVRNGSDKLTPPPRKASVTAAMATLADDAAAANAELQPGWQETTSVDLTDVAALTKTMQDLDFLAQDSPHWRRCEQALQVLVAAIRAQEGVSGPATPSTAPTDATSPAG
jgi:hypothetical protein